jgi:RND family efflux transporter MFP subunit
VFIATALLAVCAAGCLRRPTPEVPVAEPGATTRAVATAERTALPEEGFLGMVLAPETVDVTSQLEARLVNIRVRPGDRVARGDVLAQLDTSSARQELAIAVAELAAAHTASDQSKLELAESEERLARRQVLVELPIGSLPTVSDEELSTSRFQQRAAEVKVAAAAANVSSKAAHLAQLRLLLAEGAVRAPFDCTVAVRYADVGALIHKGAPVVRIIASGELRVRFAIPEERGNVLALGDPVRIVAGEESLRGAVEKINPEIDAAARMIFAEASLDLSGRSSGLVRSGQAARVHLASRGAQALAKGGGSDVRTQ